MGFSLQLYFSTVVISDRKPFHTCIFRSHLKVFIDINNYVQLSMFYVFIYSLSLSRLFYSESSTGVYYFISVRFISPSLFHKLSCLRRQCTALKLRTYWLKYCHLFKRHRSNGIIIFFNYTQLYIYHDFTDTVQLKIYS